MDDIGFWEGIVRSLSGRGQFRLILQPTVALVLGVRLGIADGQNGRAPFLFRLLTGKQGRWSLFKHSLWDAAIPLTIACALDGVLQYLTLGRVRPLAALVVGALLVWIPFAISRALANRMWTRRRQRSVAQPV